MHIYFSISQGCKLWMVKGSPKTNDMRGRRWKLRLFQMNVGRCHDHKHQYIRGSNIFFASWSQDCLFFLWYKLEWKNNNSMMNIIIGYLFFLFYMHCVIYFVLFYFYIHCIIYFIAYIYIYIYTNISLHIVLNISFHAASYQIL